jgi:hypothetical protein
MLALWRMAGRPEHYVFMGSEGEAFVIAEDERALITLITMGYDDIIGRGSLEPTPAELWGEYNERPWPEPIELKQFTAREFGIDYPQRGADLLPYSEGDDPFESFCKDLMTN